MFEMLDSEGDSEPLPPPVAPRRDSLRARSRSKRRMSLTESMERNLDTVYHIPRRMQEYDQGNVNVLDHASCEANRPGTVAKTQHMIIYSLACLYCFLCMYAYILYMLIYIYMHIIILASNRQNS